MTTLDELAAKLDELLELQRGLSMRRAYSPKEIAMMLGVGIRTVYRLMESGQLAWVQVQSERRISLRMVDDFLDSQ